MYANQHTQEQRQFSLVHDVACLLICKNCIRPQKKWHFLHIISFFATNKWLLYLIKCKRFYPQRLVRSNVKFNNLTLSWEVCCNHKLPSLCTTYQLHPNATFLLLYLKKSIEEGGSEVLSTCVCKHVAKRHTNNFVSLFSNFLCILFYYRDKEWQISVFAKCNFLCWLGRRCVTVL